MEGSYSATPRSKIDSPRIDGSTGGLVPVSDGFPLKACGNDGLREKITSREQIAGMRPAEIKSLLC